MRYEFLQAFLQWYEYKWYELKLRNEKLLEKRMS